MFSKILLIFVWVIIALFISYCTGIFISFQLINFNADVGSAAGLAVVYIFLYLAPIIGLISLPFVMLILFLLHKLLNKVEPKIGWSTLSSSKTLIIFGLILLFLTYLIYLEFK